MKLLKVKGLSYLLYKEEIKIYEIFYHIYPLANKLHREYSDLPQILLLVNICKTSQETTMLCRFVWFQGSGWIFKSINCNFSAWSLFTLKAYREPFTEDGNLHF